MKKTLLTIACIISFISYQFAQDANGVILSDTGNITIIKVWGTHQQRGFAVGYLLADKIKNLYEGYIKPQFGSNLSVAKQTIQQGIHISVDEIYKQETQGMIEGITAAGVTMAAGTDYLDILVANSFLDLQGLGGSFTNMTFGTGCSSFMSWGDATMSSDLQGKSVISRHLDWEVNSVLNANQVIIIHYPSEANEQPWFLIGFAGQLSVLSGINNSGVCAFQHMMSGSGLGSGLYNKAYEPIWFSTRKALETNDYNGDGINNTQDIKAVLAENINGYADGYIVSSLAPSTQVVDSLVAMVAEVNPVAPYLSFRSNEYNDSIPGDNLYAANSPIKRNNARAYCSRYYNMINRIKNYYNDGDSIGTFANWEIMRLASNAGSGNIQFMQYIPENREFSLSVYKNATPAYLNNKMTFDLDDFFTAPVSIASINNKSEVQIYPNPAKDKVIITCTENIAQLSIYDVTGKLITQKTDITQKQCTFAPTNVKQGFYFYKITTQSGFVYNGKIIFQ